MLLSAIARLSFVLVAFLLASLYFLPKSRTDDIAANYCGEIDLLECLVDTSFKLASMSDDTSEIYFTASGLVNSGKLEKSRLLVARIIALDPSDRMSRAEFVNRDIFRFTLITTIKEGHGVDAIDQLDATPEFSDYYLSALELAGQNPRGNTCLRDTLQPNEILAERRVILREFAARMETLVPPVSPTLSVGELYNYISLIDIYSILGDREKVMAIAATLPDDKRSFRKFQEAILRVTGPNDFPEEFRKNADDPAPVIDLSPWDHPILRASEHIDQGDYESAIDELDAAIRLIPDKAKRVLYSFNTGPFISADDQRDAPRTAIAEQYLRMGDHENFNRFMTRVSSKGQLRSWRRLIEGDIPVEKLLEKLMGYSRRTVENVQIYAARELMLQGNVDRAISLIMPYVNGRFDTNYAGGTIVVQIALFSSDPNISDTAISRLATDALASQDPSDIASVVYLLKTCARY